VDSFSYGVVLWEIITKERSQRGNWRPVRVPDECPAEVEALLQVRMHLVCAVPLAQTPTQTLLHPGPAADRERALNPRSSTA
jgi:hypothetical protein